MENKYIKFLLSVLVISFIVPQITVASWWNPFSWNIWNSFSNSFGFVLNKTKPENIVTTEEILVKTETDQNKNGDEIKKEQEQEPENEILPQTPKKIASNLSDPAGQIVHHLFNIEGAPSAKGVAFTLDGKEIWTTLLLNQKRGVSVFSAINGEKITDINLSNGGGVEIIFSLDGTKAYVSQMETGKIFEIDVISKKVLRIFNTEGVWTKFLVLSPDGKNLFASNWSSNDVSQINLDTGMLVKKIKTVATPRGLYITKDNAYLYVAGFAKGEIQKIDLNTGKSSIIFKSGGAMRQIVGDEDKGLLFVSDMGKGVIWQVSIKDDEVKNFATTDINPNTIELSPDKKILFASCRGANYSTEIYNIPGPEWGSVLMFDTQTGKMLDAIIGGNQPTALAISSDSQKLIFSDFLDARLEVFQIPSYEVFLNGNGGRSLLYKNELKK